MARIFMFRGKTLEQLQAMPVDEFSKMLKSRQRRALKRNGIQFKQLSAKADRVKKSGSGKTVRTTIREAVILPKWVGMTFSVHDGKQFKDLHIAPEMIGHRLGEFAGTTKHVVHSAPGIRATRGSKFLAVK